LNPYNDSAWVGDYTYLGFYKPIQYEKAKFWAYVVPSQFSKFNFHSKRKQLVFSFKTTQKTNGLMITPKHWRWWKLRDVKYSYFPYNFEFSKNLITQKHSILTTHSCKNKKLIFSMSNFIDVTFKSITYCCSSPPL
jgi:hypothetical protein